MRKQKQIVTLLLVAQLLTLVSCGGETAENQANTNSDTTTPAVDTGETEAKPDLPDRDLEGRTFTVYTRSAPGLSQYVLRWTNPVLGWRGTICTGDHRKL